MAFRFLSRKKSWKGQIKNSVCAHSVVLKTRFMEYKCYVPSSPSRATRFFRLGFRITAVIGLLIGIITVFWQVTWGIPQYFLMWRLTWTLNSFTDTVSCWQGSAWRWYDFWTWNLFWDLRFFSGEYELLPRWNSSKFMVFFNSTEIENFILPVIFGSIMLPISGRDFTSSSRLLELY